MVNIIIYDVNVLSLSSKCNIVGRAQVVTVVLSVGTHAAYIVNEYIATGGTREFFYNSSSCPDER